MPVWVEITDAPVYIREGGPGVLGVCVLVYCSLSTVLKYDSVKTFIMNNR